MKKYKIKLIDPLNNINYLIDCYENQYILEAAESFGINLPYACRSGACSSCLGKLLTGKINQDNQIFLNKKQIELGFILTCITYPLSNSELLINQENNLF